MVREFYLNKDSIQPAADTGGLLVGWEPGGRARPGVLLRAASLGLGLPRWPTSELLSHLTGLGRIPPPPGGPGPWHCHLFPFNPPSGKCAGNDSEEWRCHLTHMGFTVQ